MKKARPFVVGNSGAVGVKKGIKEPKARTKRIPREELEPIAAGVIQDGPVSVDATVMAALRAALGPITTQLMNAVLERKLLPHRIVCAVELASFMSDIFIAARAAHVITGVPASVLIAEAWHLGSYAILTGVRPAMPNDLFDTGKSFASMGASFMDHASHLATDRMFQPVMRAKDDPVQYLKELGRCKLWDDQGRKDRVATIFNNCLQECDEMPAEARFVRRLVGRAYGVPEKDAISS